MRERAKAATLAFLAILLAGSAGAGYVNFEVAHVHPLDLTPSGGRLLAVNTPDARLEVFTVLSDGSLTPERSIPVGLEPVSVAARTDGEAWVVNNLSDTISIVDLALGVAVKTLFVGDEPTDVAFTAGKAFVAVSQEDAVKVFNLANLDAAPAVVSLAGRDVRSLAVSSNGQKVYAAVLRSGNGTSVVNAKVVFGNNPNLNAPRLAALGLRDMRCDPTGPPPYPPLPAGIARNPALTDPPPASHPPVGLIVRWDGTSSQWRDEAGQNWSHCLPYHPADKDLFIIDAASLALTEVAGLGTSLFEVSVNLASGKVYVPNTEARNFVRFEHPLGVQGHVVDNRLSIVDPAAGNAVTIVDLNTHIDRQSNPATNFAERTASISQPGMLVWKADGSAGYLTAIGSRKLFRVDGNCLSGSCVFGPSRTAPMAVAVGEGPTGVALHEGKDRLYVLNRISHSIAEVVASTLTRIGEVPLHDPSSQATLLGRRFLYDAIDTSGHGDAACSSCHVSGDLDGLAWDLGNPAGNFVPYSTALDNVRFVVPQGGVPVACDPDFCAAHDGFDPQKGPMATQTLRGMLEPLHWRGDRPTMNDFNMAFVSLMGRQDIGPINGKPAGVSAEDMERFRQFALEMRFPPNPHRTVSDATPCGPRSTDPTCEVQVHGSLLPGNPTEGKLLFDGFLADSGQPCVACHAHPFGAAGGKLGGVAPAEPTSADAAALFFGTADGSPHNDLKIPHLRNMYDKFGPVWASPGGPSPETKVGFGLTHDGSFPDPFRFLSLNVFSLSAQQVRDLASFLFHFPTGTKPAVGRQVTLPQGAPPTGSAAEETLLATLIGLGNLGDANRHCELVASTISGGRPRSYHLSGGSWVTDLSGESPMTTSVLRQSAEAAISFTCATIGAGPRLGGNRDEDGQLDGEDCAPADPGSWASPDTVTGFLLAGKQTTTLTWDDQALATGPALRFDVLGGALSSLRAVGISVTNCIAADLDAPSHADARPNPGSGDGHYYLIRARNSCGVGPLGPGRESLETLECP